MTTELQLPPVPLGDRMKAFEKQTRTVLPARTYTVLRLDGKAFHTYTRGLARPFDEQFMSDMDSVAQTLCEKISGTVLAYVQSDEISLVLTDFENDNTQAWFGGQVQKMVSVSAATASATLTRLRPEQDLAVFDARIFTLPTLSDVQDYLVWRQRDATKNSISMAAYTHFSHKSMAQVNSDGRLEALSEIGVNWQDFPAGFRLGRLVSRYLQEQDIVYRDKRFPDVEQRKTVMRSVWRSSAAMQFSDGMRNWTGPELPVLENS